MTGRVCAAWVLGVGIAVAQAPAPPPSVPAKPMAFDVISIRQNLAPRRDGPPVFGSTGDGYRMVGGNLILAMMAAYIPTTGASAFMPNQIKNLPDWMMQEAYDIDAKVSDQDLAAWQDPAKQKAMLPAMMQALFQDRFKLAAHPEIQETNVYWLVVTKGGPKFKETDPTAEHPDGIKLPWGGVLVESSGDATLYGTSMQSLATLLSSMGGQSLGRAVQDKTGLTGRYDVTLKRPNNSGPSDQAGGPSDPGAGPAAMLFSVVDSLGLKLEPGKSTVETLVIDHVERPSAN